MRVERRIDCIYHIGSDQVKRDCTNPREMATDLKRFMKIRRSIILLHAP